MTRILLLLMALAAPVLAQEEADLPPVPETGEAMPEAGSAAPPAAVQAAGAVLRWLDKVSGLTGDLELARGQVGQTGRLSILLDDCRYPADGVPTEAFAHLVVMDNLLPDPVFSGWMVAESPALSAMDHSRYDVWVLRCLTE
jgi:hypothetical protein